MQTQDAPAEIIFKLWPWLKANKNRLIGALAAIIVISGVFYFISSQRQQKEIDAGEALTALMITPPPNNDDSEFASELEQFAAKYSGTAAAQRAQLQAANALFDAGKYADAQAQFQAFLTANPAGLLAAPAQLGVATSLEAQGKLDLAASAYQKIISVYADSTSVPEAEFALGRIAQDQNKLNEALGHFENASRYVNMGSSLAQEAMIRAAELRATLAAAAPKPAATPQPAGQSLLTLPPATKPPALSQPAAKP